MGIIVQREFTVAPDDRLEFERLSREGVWERMRHYGSQMVAFGTWALGGSGEFGTWALGGSGEVVVTHSAYVDFDHWTATRPWGAFHSDREMLEETREFAAIAGGRPRLVLHSRARVYRLRRRAVRADTGPPARG